MKAGKLRHKIYILQPTDNATSRGDNEPTYDENTKLWRWGSIEPLIGRELLFAQQIRADVTHKITIRYNGDITHRTKLRWFNGRKNLYFHSGPLINPEMKNIENNFYAVQIH